MSVGATSQTSPVMLRTPDGRVEPRLYSPLSGPMLQAANAAAGAAYVGERMLGGTDQS